jgi:hypothetical protein
MSLKKTLPLILALSLMDTGPMNYTGRGRARHSKKTPLNKTQLKARAKAKAAHKARKKSR